MSHHLDHTIGPQASAVGLVGSTAARAPVQMREAGPAETQVEDISQRKRATTGTWAATEPEAKATAAIRRTVAGGGAAGSSEQRGPPTS